MWHGSGTVSLQHRVVLPHRRRLFKLLQYQRLVVLPRRRRRLLLQPRRLLSPPRPPLVQRPIRHMMCRWFWLVR